MKICKLFLLVLTSFLLFSCKYSEDPVQFLSGIWNNTLIKDVDKYDEAMKPYKLECNQLYYLGWVGSTHIFTKEVSPYLAVVNGSFAITDAKINRKIIDLVIVYQPDRSDFLTTKMKIHLLAKDMIWFEVDEKDVLFTDYLLNQGFLYGKVNIYYRAPKWSQENN